MRKIILTKLIAPIFILLSFSFYAQTTAPPVCNGSQFYAIGNPFVSNASMKIFCQPVPLPANTTMQTPITGGFPNPVGCLAIGPAFNYNAPNPTFWVASGGSYWYYNNSGNWINTGHSTGLPLALNAGGGGSKIYNLAGAAGQVYVFNGSGPGTLLTTISGFNGTGIFDITADDADNFYILKTDGPQFLRVYNSAGVMQCSYNLSGIPTGTTPVNGGFAIVKNNIVCQANGGVYSGTILPGNPTITFNLATTSSSISSSVDFANCSLPIPKGNTSSLNSTLTCTNPLVQLNASIDPNDAVGVVQGPPSSSLNTCPYTWSGPGIVSGQSTATVMVNQPGVYSYTTCTGFCPIYTVTGSYTVTSQVTSITPSISAPTCMSNTASLIVTPNSSSYNFAWMGPGITNGQGTPTVEINTQGIYFVTVSYGNCTGSASVAIQTPTLKINPHTPKICEDGSIILSALGSALSYSWSPPIGLSATTGITVSASPTSSQTYTLTGSFNGCSVSVVETLSVIPKPNIAVSAQPTIICEGDNSTLTVVGADSYLWHTSASLNITSGAVVIANPTENTSYNVSGEKNGCVSTASILIKVVPIPKLSLNSSGNKICSGNSVSLTASGAENYSWTPSSGLSALVGNSVIASPASTNSYTLWGINQTGTLQCLNTATFIIEVIPNTAATVSNSVSICKGDKAELFATGGNEIIWTPALGLNKTEGSYVIAKPDENTTYTVTTSNNGACKSFTTVAVQVNPLPTLTTSCDANLNINEPIFINAMSNGEINWISGEGILCNTCARTQIFPKTNNCYLAMAKNKFGCSVLEELCITINDDFDIYVPNTFTPNGDGLNDSFYPIISAAHCKSYSFDIFDRWGELIYHSNDQTQTQWNGEYRNEPSTDGTYVWKLTLTSSRGKAYQKVGYVTIIK